MDELLPYHAVKVVSVLLKPWDLSHINIAAGNTTRMRLPPWRPSRLPSYVVMFAPMYVLIIQSTPRILLRLTLVQMYSGVLVLDGNRARFATPDWKTMLVVKVLRSRLREMLTRSFKNPGKLPTAQHEKWLEVWQRIFEQDLGDSNNKSLLAVANVRTDAAA